MCVCFRRVHSGGAIEIALLWAVLFWFDECGKKYRAIRKDYAVNETNGYGFFFGHFPRLRRRRSVLNLQCRINAIGVISHILRHPHSTHTHITWSLYARCTCRIDSVFTFSCLPNWTESLRKKRKFTKKKKWNIQAWKSKVWSECVLLHLIFESGILK